MKFAKEAVLAIADTFGFSINEEVQHCAECLINSLWNYTRETNDDGSFDKGTYGWVVGSIANMMNKDNDGICLTSLHEASQRVQDIRLSYLWSMKQEREARIAEMKRKA